MSILNQLARLVSDPPPNHLFELSEAGIAFAAGKQTGFQAFEPGTLQVSPVDDNVLRADAAAAAIARITPESAAKKRKPAAVILPDYAARVSVLDFDSFPSGEAEQAALVRFRVKKTIPFDIESAAVSFYVQPSHAKAAGSNGAAAKRIEVIAVTIALNVVARYEALFRAAGFHPGVVTTSTLAALNLYRGDGVSVLAKLSGRVLTVSVISGGVVKLFRCVALEESSDEEILAVLNPTFAYVEDELSEPVKRVVVCGIGAEVASRVAGRSNAACEVEPLRSRFGVPGEFNAGLLGYMESVG